MVIEKYTSITNLCLPITTESCLYLHVLVHVLEVYLQWVWNSLFSKHNTGMA